jgi:ribosome biogenesis GTPase
MIELYSSIGYTCLAISAKTGLHVETVREMMSDKTSMFAGNSGVGKSTLINRLSPELQIKTSETSEMHRQGQHTTTFAQMYDLEFGARIIDTPGIKGFGLVDMEPEEIGDYFPELFALKGSCKFNNCLHLDEPNCAVKEALEEGQIAESRYRSYVQMISEDRDTYRQDFFQEL